MALERASELVPLGFPFDLCVEALGKVPKAEVQAAANWLMENGAVAMQVTGENRHWKI